MQEIRGSENPTRIANAPAFIKGVLDLRGLIVQIVDLRLRFCLEHAAYDALTVTVILNVAGRVAGAVVDSIRWTRSSNRTQHWSKRAPPRPRA